MAAFGARRGAAGDRAARCSTRSRTSSCWSPWRARAATWRRCWARSSPGSSSRRWRWCWSTSLAGLALRSGTLSRSRALAWPHRAARRAGTQDLRRGDHQGGVARRHLRALRGRAAGADRGASSPRASRSSTHVGPAVCVFGSARTVPGDEEYEQAREVGRAIGEAGMAVITGGGPGTMEAANRGAREAGALSVGLNIELPARAGPEPLRRPRHRVPLLLRAQADVRALLRRLRLLPRRLRDARRDLRGADPDPDRQGGGPPGRARGHGRVLAQPDGAGCSGTCWRRAALGRGPGAGRAGRGAADVDGRAPRRHRRRPRASDPR